MFDVSQVSLHYHRRIDQLSCMQVHEFEDYSLLSFWGDSGIRGSAGPQNVVRSWVNRPREINFCPPRVSKPPRLGGTPPPKTPILQA